MTDRPVKRISDGLERLTQVNFSERIEPFSDPLGSNQYNTIIERINKMADELAGVETLRTDFVYRLKRLDRKAELPGTLAGIAVGLTGVLILTGGVMLLLSFSHFAAGAEAGAVGFILAALATPVSKAVTKRSLEKYRDEILALSEKIKNGN